VVATKAREKGAEDEDYRLRFSSGLSADRDVGLGERRDRAEGAESREKGGGAGEITGFSDYTISDDAPGVADGDHVVLRVVICQYSSAAKSKQNTIAKRYRLGSASVFVLTIVPCGFGFQLGNLPAHLRNPPLQSFLGHKERTQQVPTQIEKVRNRLE
jgi:hypothetical protein